MHLGEQQQYYFSSRQIFFVFIFLGMLLVSYIFHLKKLVSKKVVTLLVVFFSSLVPVIFSLDAYRSYGLGFAVEYFMGEFLLFLVSLSLGATVWWRIYHKGIRS